MEKKILVTGAAGYIGSFMLRVLQEKGYTPIALDDLSRGHREVVPEDITFYQGKVGDDAVITKIVEDHAIKGVIHFAGYISMKESMDNPGVYFDDNTFQTLKLLESLKKNNVGNIIFSSTAGVYGNPERIPISEDDTKIPTNPYGESKLMVEKILAWYQRNFDMSFAALRYFNACGAQRDGSLGENHQPETHIIPLAIKALLNGTEFNLYGSDYNTPDGTCVRDYIHVLDLAEAHVLALEKIIETPGAYYYNVGTGKGFSNKEIVEKVEEVSGKKINVKMSDRRPGDADELVADVTKIKSELSFEPKHSDLQTIIESAWKWHTSSTSNNS